MTKVIFTGRKWIIASILVLFSLTSGFFLLQYSSVTKFWGMRAYLQNINMLYMLLNIATLSILLALLWAISGRLWLSCFLHNSICGILAVINYYVIEFHGMPMSFLLIKNFRTAMNVISTYDFMIDDSVLLILFGMACGLLVAIGYRLILKPVPIKRHRCKYNCLLLVLSFIVMYIGYLSPDSIMPKDRVCFSWLDPYGEYGYIACTVDSARLMIKGVNEPLGGYSQSRADEVIIDNRQAMITQMPDVIVIMNESFYDLRQITDMNTNIPYLGNIEITEEILKGYAISPQYGGGTNASEYELLTSNSLQLMPGITPFNTLDLENANSIASFMNALGYTTVGCHTADSFNYSRGYGYPAIGFKETHFEPDFQHLEFYYDRHLATDKSAYKNLLRWYDEMPEEKPRFMYMLTIQNHGAYDLNKEEYDIVHTTHDFGDYTQHINEFLTSIYMSDRAFKELIDQFKQRERSIIVCMVGDHCPSFSYEIVSKEDQEDVQLRLRKMPLLVWANIPLKDKALGTIGMNMVIPTLLDMAQMPLSPYYSYLLEVKDCIPVMTAYNYYYDIYGEQFVYADEGSKYAPLLTDYFHLEYQNIKTSENRRIYLPYDY